MGVLVAIVAALRAFVRYGREVGWRRAGREWRHSLLSAWRHRTVNRWRDVRAVAAGARARTGAGGYCTATATWRSARPGDTPGELVPEHGPAQPVDLRRASRP